ncbi:protein-disulfide reductase DsbD domain-containing protein [Rhizobium sp. EC-SD404]|uniref:protein-disulfide reductase DsbD domain-containing protein n=1 Tax=Rhizobium sp. EC-SD404 TaxID=2038389 RepID=UPI0012546A7D|nr:protein-disulfide reductase DsbD domain-containing protein [Rhizobium sp. EC-SD404]VVT27224.1 Thiol-disulfide interchange protein, contains DsbC and DsbD domains [Rhizobium sp. EC-SD404]
MTQNAASRRKIQPFALVGRSVATFALVAALAHGPAFAASSDWVEHEGGRLRIVTSTPDADGVVRGMLDIELTPGWKTYWSDPGDSGLPPQMNISGSTNLSAVELLFPAPERVDDGYAVWAGYTSSVRLPFRLHQETANDAASLVADILIGVCKSVCIPVDAQLDVALSQAASPIETALVDQAFSTLPGEKSADMSIDAVTLDPSDDHRLLVDVRLPSDEAAAAAELFIATPTGWRLGTPKRVETEGQTSRFAVKIKRQPDDLGAEAAPLTFVLKTHTHSIQQDLHAD